MLKKIVKNLKASLGVGNESIRDSWLEKILIREQEGKTILDAGAGEQRNKKFCPHLNYLSQDICVYDGKSREYGLQTGSWDTSSIDIVSDITAIPLSNGAVDIILCTEVLEHVPNPVAAIEEFSRLLKPGGRLILTAPFASVMHFAPFFYNTGFSRYWYFYHLEKASFRVLEITSNGGYFALVYQELIRTFRLTISRNNFIIGLLLGFVVLIYGIVYKLSLKRKDDDKLACFGHMVIAEKNN